MKSSTWRGGANFTLDELPDPEPTRGYVTVKIDTAGVCGTDVHITQGLFPSDCPKVLGHEASGVIVEVGEDVPSGRIGQRVALNGTSHCWECWTCRSWSVSRCENGQTPSNGFYAQCAAVPAQAATPIPESLPLEIAAMTEPASCCLSGVEMLDIPNRATALVIGGGIMGLFTLAFLKSHGVDVAVMSEPVKERREMALRFGADVLHDPNEIELEELVAELTADGRGFDVTAEAVGKPSLVAKCIELTRPRGQTLMIGVSPEGSPLPVDLYDMHYREIKLIGAFGRGNVFHRVPGELEHLDLDGVVSGRFHLDQVADAIHASAEGMGVKFVIKPNG